MTKAITVKQIADAHAFYKNTNPEVVFNRKLASAYLSMLSVPYESKQLTAVTKEYLASIGVSGSRITMKERLINDIGVTIFDEQGLCAFLEKEGKTPDETEVKKYIRYLRLAERIAGKYNKQLKDAK